MRYYMGKNNSEPLNAILFSIRIPLMRIALTIYCGQYWTTNFNRYLMREVYYSHNVRSENFDGGTEYYTGRGISSVTTFFC
jgi:hypothetical protein